VVNIVTGFGDAGAALAAHDDVDKVAFTGSTEVGKLIVKAAAAGQSAGAEAVVGGGRAADRGYFVQPTILANTSNDMSVVREEIFGPVVGAIPFGSSDDILPIANDTNYGLAAGVFTRDISKAHRTAKRLRAGTVWINTYHVFDAAMPFGGYKESGWGREMGSQVLNNYLETKSVVTAL
jgi:acyl-CoA reductase-like NAD-dependent aldehyde dehydrogenase